MRRCFCGCGRAVPRFPLGSRAINTRGRLVRERLDWARDTLEDLDRDWARRGDASLLQLRAGVHQELDVKQVHPLEPEVRRWQRQGREFERQALAAGASSLRQWLTRQR